MADSKASLYLARLEKGGFDDNKFLVEVDRYIKAAKKQSYDCSY